MNHPFYNKSQRERNQFLLAIAMGAFAMVALAGVISYFLGIYLFGIVVTIILITIIAPFFDMPTLKGKGTIIYYSPLFISERPKNDIIKIHGGTLLDYYFVINTSWNGKQRTAFIIQQYLEGLLNLMDEYKNEPEMKVMGTSYIINERTAKKMGFEVVETNMMEKLILIFNYFNVMITQTIAKDILAFPKLYKTKTFESTISQLLERESYLM